MHYYFAHDKTEKYKRRPWYRLWQSLQLDGLLLSGILVLEVISLLLIYSTSNQNLALTLRHLLNFGIAFVIMLVFARIPPKNYLEVVPWFFGLVIMILVIVLIMGVVSKGAQRWLSLGFIRFQPSEMMKIAVPMMLAWYLRDRVFPLGFQDLCCCLVIIMVPALLIAKQPDLGTAVLVTVTGIFVLLLAGIRWRVLLTGICSSCALLPVIWHFMHHYQKMRLLIFLSPESDPLHRGYNVIQSKIAIGSGGFWGKGWLQGSQSHLHFLPEASTDFAFAVYSEEFGLIGFMLLFAVFVIVIARSMYISAHAQDTFSRLLAGSLTLSFFCSIFVNIGMVSSILPVVGVPLPFLSYGGSSLIIFMASFGIITSIYKHRKLISS